MPFMRSSQLSYTPEMWKQYTGRGFECQPAAGPRGLFHPPPPTLVPGSRPKRPGVLNLDGPPPHTVCMPNPEAAFAAICPVGLEKVLAQEIARLGMPIRSKSRGRVLFPADPRGAARALCSLRTADRVLAAPGSFHAPDFDSLYEGMRALSWEEWIGKNDRVTIVRVRSRSSALEAQTSIQSVAHKAIYERLGRVYRLARLPESGPEREVRIYLEDDLCSPLVDLSGEPLYKRGWRAESVEAPLRETIAAGLLFLTGWTRKRPFRDPFCGGGTLAIEAALWARDEAPNLRRPFAWETMPSFSPPALKEVRGELEARIRKDAEADILGSDSDEQAVKISASNARRAGVGGLVRFERRPMEESSAEGACGGLVLSNPPYGLRIGTEKEAEETWTRSGGLRERYPGWSFGFVANREDFPSFFGARPSSSRTLQAGAERLWFHWYPADSGSGGQTPRDGKGKNLRPSRTP